MRKSAFSLQAYLALTRSAGSARPTGDRPGPEALRNRPLIWCHSGHAPTARAMESLAQRIALQHDEACILRTGAQVGATPADRADMAIFHDTLPNDAPASAQDFIGHWAPKMLIWSGNDLSPGVLAHARDTAGRMVFVNAEDDGFSTPAPRWMPDVASATLDLFDEIFAMSEASARRLRRMAIRRARIRSEGALLDTALPLACDPRDHEAMAATLSGRPVWLAAHLCTEEADDVLRAHRRAGRLAHRLLLVVVPARGNDPDAIAAKVAAAGLRVADWDAGDTIEDGTQIVLAREAEELGLWYRVAPVSFIGGSLAPGIGGHDPYEGAALGSALLYGPNVGSFLSAYSRLAKAGAARIVRDADTLAAAVTQAIQPDQSAAMAHAGWDVVSQSAELVDRILDLVAETLDEAPT